MYGGCVLSDHGLLMEARKLCPPETFSVINHNQKKLLAYNYWRQKEGYNIKKNGNF